MPVVTPALLYSGGSITNTRLLTTSQRGSTARSSSEVLVVRGGAPARQRTGMRGQHRAGADRQQLQPVAFEAQAAQPVQQVLRLGVVDGDGVAGQADQHDPAGAVPLRRQGRKPGQRDADRAHRRRPGARELDGKTLGLAHCAQPLVGDAAPRPGRPSRARCCRAGGRRLRGWVVAGVAGPCVVHLARGALGQFASGQPLDECRLMSMPALMPAELTMRPLSTQRTPSRTSSEGKRSRRSAMSSQWVVTVSFVITPLSASRKAPVQTEATTCAPAALWAIQRRVSGLAIGASITPPGTISTSAFGLSASAWLASSCRPARACTGWPCAAWATDATSNGAAVPGCIRWLTRLAVVNTSKGPAKSSASTPSKARMSTRKLMPLTPRPVRAPVPRCRRWRSGPAARWRCGP